MNVSSSKVKHKQYSIIDKSQYKKDGISAANIILFILFGEYLLLKTTFRMINFRHLTEQSLHSITVKIVKKLSDMRRDYKTVVQSSK